MKALVFGVNGQVATELARRVPPGVALTRAGRAQADLTDPAACAALIAASDADVVINAAAYTAVDRAEAEEPLATLINATAPTAMARAAAAKQTPFLQISTDYVFDGSGVAPHLPDAPTGPVNAYGRGKAAGEAGVRGAGGPHAILRTSWVFSAHGTNFVRTMLRLAGTRDRLNVVEDQTGGPTAAADIADALWVIATELHKGAAQGGTYHFAGAPDTSWAGFARMIFQQAGRDVAVTGIPTTDYPTPAARPLNSRLDCTATETVFGLKRPDWRASLTHVLQELSEAPT